MREKNVREINLTKENICFANKISVEDNVIAAECTLLFDVDKYFGTTTKKDNTWISFDVCWTPNGSVHAEYRLRSFDDCCKCLVDWRLTEEEQEIILDKMVCKKLERLCKNYGTHTRPNKNNGNTEWSGIPGHLFVLTFYILRISDQFKERSIIIHRSEIQFVKEMKNHEVPMLRLVWDRKGK